MRSVLMTLVAALALLAFTGADAYAAKGGHKSHASKSKSKKKRGNWCGTSKNRHGGNRHRGCTGNPRHHKKDFGHKKKMGERKRAERMKKERQASKKTAELNKNKTTGGDKTASTSTKTGSGNTASTKTKTGSGAGTKKATPPTLSGDN